MLRKMLLTFFILGLLTAVIPVAGQSGTSCDIDDVSQQLAAYSEEIVTATVAEIVTIQDEIDALLTTYLTDCAEEAADNTTRVSTGEVLFTVVATGNVNIRSCAGTTCQVVTAANTGRVYNVIGEEDDWYEIELDNGQTGFIASWLTTRGPDEMIDIYAGYIDVDLTCGIQAAVTRSTSNDLDFAISGDGRSEVVVDIIRPNNTNPEPVWQQYHKTFIDTGDPYIHQVYRSSYWPTGMYQLRVERAGITKVFGFNLNQTGDTTIFVTCV